MHTANFPYMILVLHCDNEAPTHALLLTSRSLL